MPDDRLFQRVPVDAAYQIHIDLDEIRPHLVQQVKPGPAGPDIVQRDLEAGLPVKGENAFQMILVLDAVRLGQLERDIAGLQAKLGNRRRRGPEAIGRIVDAGRIEIHEQPALVTAPGSPGDGAGPGRNIEREKQSGMFRELEDISRRNVVATRVPHPEKPFQCKRRRTGFRVRMNDRLIPGVVALRFERFHEPCSLDPVREHIRRHHPADFQRRRVSPGSGQDPRLLQLLLVQLPEDRRQKAVHAGAGYCYLDAVRLNASMQKSDLR